ASSSSRAEPSPHEDGPPSARPFRWGGGRRRRGPPSRGDVALAAVGRSALPETDRSHAGARGGPAAGPPATGAPRYGSPTPTGCGHPDRATRGRAPTPTPTSSWTGT